MLDWLGKIFIAPFFYLLFRPRMLHSRRFRSKGKVIYVCNHFSLADPVALAALCPRTIHFMAREGLFSSPIARFFFWSIFVFPAGEEGGSRLGPVKRALSLLKREKAFGIFPEGHRSAGILEMDEMERGAAFIALRSGASVIPVYIDPMSWRRFRVRGAVGEPICPDTFREAKGIKPVEAMTRAITSSLQALREETESIIFKWELQK